MFILNENASEIFSEILNLFTALNNSLINNFNKEFVIYFIIIIIISILFILFLYIYYALAWSTIAKKLNCNLYWLAWIPFLSFFLKPILADKDWRYGFLIFVPILYFFFFFKNLFYIIFVIIIILYIFILNIIWTKEIYIKRGYPGNLSFLLILFILPTINLIAIIVDLIVIGNVAWKDKNKIETYNNISNINNYNKNNNKDNNKDNNKI
jgi:hypothetical protein